MISLRGKKKYFTKDEVKKARILATKRCQQKKRENGLCIQCGTELLSINSKNYCQKCISKHNEYEKIYRIKLTNEGKCINCAVNTVIPGTKYCIECKNKDKKRRERYYDRIKQQVFEYYGGFRCTCCGITEPIFLCIDHINNDGAEHRRKVGKANIYLWLVKNNFPEGFQVLCYNCNMAKRLNNGKCIHKTEK